MGANAPIVNRIKVTASGSPPGARWAHPQSVQVKMAPRQGVIAIAYGPSPTLIGEPGVFVAVAIGTTRPGSRQTTT
jgi:hypothetical protein